MKPSIAESVLSRADGHCECGCGFWFGVELRANTTLDHFFGRARAKDSIDSIWALRADCHADKTANRPDAATWLKRFLVHCEKHGYRSSYDRAFKRLAFVEQRKAFGKVGA